MICDVPLKDDLTEVSDHPTMGLFVVWFDLGCGVASEDWWWEPPGPQPLPAALDLAAEMRSAGWICKVLPEGQNPRADGRWDNP